jgi:hypothetical protein
VFYAERGRNIASIARQLQKAVAAREEEKKKRRAMDALSALRK